MSIAWIAPAALFGVGLIALPIAIHLLVRQHARTLVFPSLRFLRETQLAALRRRTIQDAALLLCRITIMSTFIDRILFTVSSSVSPLDTDELDLVKFIVSALNLFSASSKDIRVRVEFSKKRFRIE